MLSFKTLSQVLEEISLADAAGPAHPPPRPVTPSGQRYRCKTCPGAGFNEAEDFREHHQSLWHNHNLKASLKGNPPISQRDFFEIQHIIDGSDGEYSEEEPEPSDDEELPAAISERILFTFRTADYTIYRSLLFSNKQDYRHTQVSVEMIRSFIQSQSRWAFFLVRSGRVFAAIYDFQNDSMLTSKSFKRYTERKKQGGSQLLRDKVGKVAKSAGSQMRRANELELIKDVAKLIEEWRGLLEDCQLIFWNRNFFSLLALFQPEKGLARSDPRLRTIPFETYKPCLEEVNRCLKALSNAFKVTRC